jgi:hypothetical protein
MNNILLKCFKYDKYCNYHFSKIKIGAECLAKHIDGLWHLASVVSIDEENICIQFKKFNLLTKLNWEDVFLLNELENEDENDENSDEIESSESEIDYNEGISIINVSSKHAPDQEFGNWEKYTKVNFSYNSQVLLLISQFKKKTIWKGIGSKLMAKMGYITGTGLGKTQEGRVNPVEVLALPKGTNDNVFISSNCFFL